MRTRLYAVITLGLLALPFAAARADSLQEQTEEAERLAAEAMSKLLQALDMMMDSVPQYAAPEVLPNGDIIIRRLHPEEKPAEPADPEPGDDGVDT